MRFTRKLRKDKLTSRDFDRLEDHLTALDAPMSLAETEGLLAAVASAPTMLMPSDWQKLVLGDSVFEDRDQAQDVMNLLMRLWNQTLTELNEGYAIPDIEDEDWVQLWCSGYLQGVRLDDQWRSDEKAWTLVFPAAILSGEFNLIGEPDDKGNIITDDTPQKDRARENIQLHVAAVHEYWNQWRREQMAQRDQSTPAKSKAARIKIGRNEKCPCGSGRKYKKCCGAAS